MLGTNSGIIQIVKILPPKCTVYNGLNFRTFGSWKMALIHVLMHVFENKSCHVWQLHNSISKLSFIWFSTVQLESGACIESALTVRMINAIRKDTRQAFFAPLIMCARWYQLGMHFLCSFCWLARFTNSGRDNYFHTPWKVSIIKK